jgi:hypothetical protein
MNIIAQASVSPLGKLALEPPIQQARARLQAAGLQMRSKEPLGNELIRWVASEARRYTETTVSPC